MVAFGVLCVGYRREHVAAPAAFQVMEINAQQPISGMMNELAMRACPRWLRQRMTFPLKGVCHVATCET